MSFVAELGRRNVIRMAGLYLVGAWLVTQVASTVFPAFDLPPWALRGVILLLALGFIPALVFSWVFELTPEGIRRDGGVPAEASVAARTARRMDRAIVAVLVLALAGFGFDRLVLAPRRDAALVAGTARAIATAPARPAVDARSIAVLPFVDMSQAHDQEYFSDGLSEELLNQLSQLPELRVIARTSSFSFKGKDVDVATIAKTLNVANVLEGSVRKSGNTLRITAQLVRASDSSHLWSQTYDRDLTDVFEVQDELAGAVVAALKLQLLSGKPPDSGQRTRSPAAYEQYLIATGMYRAGTRASHEAAAAALKAAIAIDPGYANAFALLSQMQWVAGEYAESAAGREAAIAESLASADKAIALAPDLPIGYVARAMVRFRTRWDWQGAQADLARALALDANNAAALAGYGPMLLTLGRREQALEVLRKASASDPLSEPVWVALARGLEAAGEAAQARQACARAIEINPQSLWANFLLGNLLLREGRTDEAIASYQRAPEQTRIIGMAMAEFTLGNEVASRQALARMEKEFGPAFAFQIAQVHAWRGEKDEAFDWLDRAYAIHDTGLVRLPFDPAMDPLRADPRFAALVRKMGFPE